MRKTTRLHLEKFLARYASSERTLDVGAGGDTYKRYFPNRVTLDVNPAYKPDIVGDAHKLPVEGASFDRILCTEVLEHLKDPRRAVAEMRRVLKPGGTLVLTTRFVYPIHSDFDYFRFTHYGLRELFADWDIVELEPETADFETIGILLERLVLQTTMRANKFSKALVFLLSRSFCAGNALIKARYGHINRTYEESHILASGYYLVARKPQSVE